MWMVSKSENNKIRIQIKILSLVDLNNFDLVLD